MNEELKQKILSSDFQDKCWKVMIEILEDKYNQKIRIKENKKDE